MKIKALMVCSLGRNPRNGGIPARDRRSNVMMIFDCGVEFTRWVWVFIDELDRRRSKAEMITRYIIR